MLVPPAIRSARTTGDSAFSVAVPEIWNILPPSLRAEDNMNIFKRELKTHLLNRPISLKFDIYFYRLKHYYFSAFSFNIYDINNVHIYIFLP